MNRTLLETSDLRYKRRLVRELNKSYEGFWWRNERFCAAKFEYHIIKVLAPGRPMWRLVPSDQEIFTDNNGQEIVASREA